MFSIRQAIPGDIATIRALDPLAQRSIQRGSFIERSVLSRECYVIDEGNCVVGYGILEYSFYELGFVAMLYICPEYRRRGAGSMLMEHFQSTCQTPKIFTSTNLSDLPMQSLLAKLRYSLSGIIHHLDENDPEVVYFKFIE